MKQNYTSILRRTLSAVLLLLLSTLAFAQGQTFFSDGICYRINADGTSVSVWISRSQEYSGDVVIPFTVIHEDKTYRVTSIEERAFSGCKSLTSISLPKGVTSIGRSAFNGCTSLTSISLPEGLMSIGAFAFSGCRSLASVDLPDGLTSIKGWAFSGCTSLTTVVCRAEDVPRCETFVFAGINTAEATLYVPASALEDYKAAAQWKVFGTILPLEDYETGIDAPASWQEGGSVAAPYYTLDGRRVASPVRGGVYVRGGRKVMVR